MYAYQSFHPFVKEAEKGPLYLLRSLEYLVRMRYVTRVMNNSQSESSSMIAGSEKTERQHTEQE